MERSAASTIGLATLLLTWFEPLPCRAQVPDPQLKAPLTDSVVSASSSAAVGSFGGPIQLLRQIASAGQPQAGRRAAASSTVDPAAGQSGQGLPLPLPSSTTLQASTPASDDTSLKLKTAPLESTDLPLPINLATALRLSDARPLIVAAAQASVWVAEAQLTRAKVLWVPQLNVGADYIRHDGGGPDFNKGILTAPSVNFFYAGGGLWQNVAATDAIFEPLAARQVLNSRRWDIQAAKNDALLQTAEAYFGVHQARGMYAGTLYLVGRGRDLVDRVSRLSADLASAVEVDRAKNMLANLEQRATSEREAWRVRSADLTQVLRLDPRAVVVPLEPDHLQISLIDPARPLDDLIPVGLTNRPELASQQALVQAVIARLRREKMRPFLPSILINGFQTPFEEIQAGIFGIGPNSSLNQWAGRADLSYQAIWQLEGMGVGNLARIKEQRGEQSRSIIELFRIQDMVAADVTRAQARLQSATARVGQADRALRSALVTFNGNYEGLQQTTRFGDVLVLVNRPQEVVYALQRLKDSFDAYFITVAEYNRAQFQLFRALGYPAREIAEIHSPGQVQPLETSRPPYLPPVSNGPPPASR
jgi:hypothetical protein